jgi:mRNA interferase MazF
MNLRRGDIVTAAFPGDLKKPRPAVILQADEFIEGHRTVLACPFSTYLAESPLFRPTVDPTAENGLEFRSQIMVDKTTPAKKAAIGQVIGRLSVEDMARVETALINIAGLRRPILPITPVEI